MEFVPQPDLSDPTKFYTFDPLHFNFINYNYSYNEAALYDLFKSWSFNVRAGYVQKQIKGKRSTIPQLFIWEDYVNTVKTVSNDNTSALVDDISSFRHFLKSVSCDVNGEVISKYGYLIPSGYSVTSYIESENLNGGFLHFLNNYLFSGLNQEIQNGTFKQTIVLNDKTTFLVHNYNGLIQKLLPESKVNNTKTNHDFVLVNNTNNYSSNLEKTVLATLGSKDNVCLLYADIINNNAPMYSDLLSTEVNPIESSSFVFTCRAAEKAGRVYAYEIHKHLEKIKIAKDNKTLNKMNKSYIRPQK